MIKLTKEIALITAVSDLKMFLDNIKGFVPGFPRIISRSETVKSPSGPIKIVKDFEFLNFSILKLSFELTSPNKSLVV